MTKATNSKKKTAFKPQKLTYRGVVKAAWKAYGEKKIQAQHSSNIIDTHCAYTSCTSKGVEVFCVIGAALTKKTRTEVMARGCNVMAVCELYDAGIVLISDKDLEAIQQLQAAHDDAVGSGTAARRRFATMLRKAAKELGISGG